MSDQKENNTTHSGMSKRLKNIKSYRFSELEKLYKQLRKANQDLVQRNNILVKRNKERNAELIAMEEWKESLAELEEENMLLRQDLKQANALRDEAQTVIEQYQKHYAKWGTFYSDYELDK